MDKALIGPEVGSRDRVRAILYQMTQFDNTVSYTTPGLGGDHLIKGGVQFARGICGLPKDYLDMSGYFFTANAFSTIAFGLLPTGIIVNNRGFSVVPIAVRIMDTSPERVLATKR